MLLLRQLQHLCNYTINLTFLVFYYKPILFSDYITLYETVLKLS